MLLELRRKCKMTQEEAANFLNISLSTYKRYENENKYINTLKYNMMVELLESYCRIDEEHGVLSIDEIISYTNSIFKNYDINFCFLFGSYAKNKQNEKSDIDLLIDSKITGLDFYGLLEELREKMHKNIDLIRFDDCTKNSDLIREIMKDGKKIYG